MNSNQIDFHSSMRWETGAASDVATFSYTLPLSPKVPKDSGRSADFNKQDEALLRQQKQKRLSSMQDFRARRRQARRRKTL
jgi:hypothetical protein